MQSVLKGGAPWAAPYCVGIVNVGYVLLDKKAMTEEGGGGLAYLKRLYHTMKQSCSAKELKEYVLVGLLFLNCYSTCSS